MYTLPDVWIRPNFGGKGRKVTGQLEAHSNGFRYSSPKGETLDIMYRSRCCPLCSVIECMHHKPILIWTDKQLKLSFSKVQQLFQHRTRDSAALPAGKYLIPTHMVHSACRVCSNFACASEPTTRSCAVMCVLQEY